MIVKPQRGGFLHVGVGIAIGRKARTGYAQSGGEPSVRISVKLRRHRTAVKVRHYRRRADIRGKRSHLLQRISPVQGLINRQIFLKSRRKRQIIAVRDPRRCTAPCLDSKTRVMEPSFADVVAPNEGPMPKWRQQTGVEGPRQDVLLELLYRDCDMGCRSSGFTQFGEWINIFRDIRSRESRLR